MRKVEIGTLDGTPLYIDLPSLAEWFKDREVAK